MRVLGIDPGTQQMGYGVVELSGTHARRIEGGVLSPAQGSLARRLAMLFDGLEAVVARARPDVVAVESLFYARNVQSALTLGHARGVALLVAGRARLEVHAYPPAVVKKAVVGHGRAEKHQVQKMIRALLGLDADPPADEADALAIALCHGQHAHFHQKQREAPQVSQPPSASRRRQAAPPPAATSSRARAGTPVVSAADLGALVARGARKTRGRLR